MIACADEGFGGIVGIAAFRVFNLEVARTGLGASEARRLGPDFLPVASVHRSRGHAYPAAAP